jgi:hypothetical protein
LEGPKPSSISELLDNESKKLKRIIDSYIVFYENPKDLKILWLKMAKIQGSDGRIDKRKIAILKIDCILD